MTKNLKYNYNLGLEFYEVAGNCRSNTAIRFLSGKEISYDELNKFSNKIARFLLHSNIQKGNVVALFNEKSFHAFATMIACLKIGVIYVNLDHNSPATRVEKILKNCKPSMICFDGKDHPLKKEISGLFGTTKTVSISTDSFEIVLNKFTDKNLPETFLVDGSNAAYIMFTSGSTGFPKGAVMTHSNLLHFISWGKQTFSITEQDILTNANPVYFDNSVFDFYNSVFNGAALVPFSADIVKDGKQLVEAISKSGCTIWFSVPSLLVYLLTVKALIAHDFHSIKKIAFGGEGFPKNKLKLLYELFGKRIQLYNVYGPTECTCICSSHIISEKDFENMNELASLGAIAPNFSYEILPAGEDNNSIGELALLGPCVGAGYYNDPQRTAEAFVQNNKSAYQQLMYRTGDLVEKRTDGLLYFRGRTDNQVKHMGYRIELEEVEAAFSSLPYVHEAGVIYEKLTPELGQIKAFVHVTDPSLTSKTITGDLKKILPDYMVPRTIIVTASLPKNSNGKIDRKQLTLLT